MSQGQHVDDTNEGPLYQLLNSVVDHRSLYVQISIMIKQVEAVCNSGASVSGLREKLFNQINAKHQVKINQVQDSELQIRCPFKTKAPYLYQSK